MLTPRTALGESLGLLDPPLELELELETLESPDTLSNDTLTPLIVSKDLVRLVVGKPTTRSITNS